MMKCVTLWRPWPHAIINSTKRIENRDYRPPQSVMGEFIALHAGKRYEDPSDGLRWPLPDDWKPPREHECPLGVVAVARIVGVVLPTGMIDVWIPAGASGRINVADTPIDLRWYSKGAFGWILSEVRALTPIPCNGMQRVWTLKPETEALVRAQMEAA